jgi:hypothetical protein
MRLSYPLGKMRRALYGSGNQTRLFPWCVKSLLQPCCTCNKSAELTDKFNSVRYRTRLRKLRRFSRKRRIWQRCHMRLVVDAAARNLAFNRLYLRHWRRCSHLPHWVRCGRLYLRHCRRCDRALSDPLGQMRAVFAHARGERPICGIPQMKPAAPGCVTRRSGSIEPACPRPFRRGTGSRGAAPTRFPWDC